MVDRVKALKSKACIVTAAASQIGRMIIRLLQKAHIEPICTVRRKEQADMLREKFGVKYVINMSEKEEFPKGMAKICMKV